MNMNNPFMIDSYFMFAAAISGTATFFRHVAPCSVTYKFTV